MIDTNVLIRANYLKSRLQDYLQTVFSLYNQFYQLIETRVFEVRR
jgi:hypothetical protein